MEKKLYGICVTRNVVRKVYTRKCRKAIIRPKAVENKRRLGTSDRKKASGGGEKMMEKKKEGIKR